MPKTPWLSLRSPSGSGCRLRECAPPLPGLPASSGGRRSWGEKNGVVVIDDFAHHPTAIALTLEAVKQAYPGGRVFGVFEPRSATSRRNVFQDQFPASFRAADDVVIAGLFAPEKIDPADRLDPDKVVADIEAQGGRAHHIPDVEAIVDHVVANARPKDVVLVMSSGGFAGIHQKLLNRL